MSKETVLHQGNFLTLKEKEGWEFVVRPNASGVVGIIPLTQKDELVFVEQFRHGVGMRVIEFPAGLVGDEKQNESSETAARRELLEETGYHAKHLEFVFSGPTSPGLCSEVIDYFIAQDLRREHEGGGVGDEDITVHHVPLHQLNDWLADVGQDRMVDSKVYAGLYFIRELKRRGSG